MIRYAVSFIIILGLSSNGLSQTIELYVDQNTKQVFTEPGKGRVRLGLFAPVVDKASAPAVVTQDSKAGEITTTPTIEAPASTVETVAKAEPGLLESKIKKEWYDKLSVKGYTQLRYTGLFDREGAEWFHPADKSVSEDNTFIVRRARLTLSGDVSDHLYFYLQPEFAASPVEGSDNSVQLRDVYGDVALDSSKEYRVRLGQSKIPFGFSNMQSSQNRGPLERADAIESAAEGNRDIGTFFYWAPAEIRKRLKRLTQDGLKGEGDYGVFALGAYSGQGANHSDTNDSVHVISRLSYPFEFSDGQIFETGIQGYTGRFVPKTKSFTLSGEDAETTPAFRSDGIKDERVGVSAILFPQPFGFEAEWNVGRGPELMDDFHSIDEQSLQGGYLQADYKVDVNNIALFPFIRWQYYDGGRKFGKNAPHELINEWDFGLELSPWKELELTAQYSYTTDRTNTNVFPYENLTGGSRLGLQAQVNY